VSLFVAEVSGPQERRRLAVCLQLAGLAAAGLLIAQTSPVFRWWHVPPAQLLLQAGALSGAAWLAGAAVTLGLYLICDSLFSQDFPAGEIGRAVMRTAATAVWFVPAIVLASALHPGALAAALVLVHHVTRLLYWQWRVSAPIAAEASVETDRLFATSLAAGPPLVRQLAPALLLSTLLQASIAMMILHRYGLARGLFYASTATITILVMTVYDSTPKTGGSIRRSCAGLVLSLLLAGGLTVGSLTPRARGGSGSAGGKDGAGYPANPLQQTPGVPRPIYNETGESFPTDSVPGVILWPEIRPVPTLIAPLPAGHGSVPRTTPQQPMSIPFSGEYWLYRWPYARPPHNSYLKRGNPAALSFRTTDHRPLQMEAHHKLDQAVDLRCCSQIQIAIRNSDRQAGSISLELVLLNTEVSPVRKQSLGTAAVKTVLEQARSGPGAMETLQFAVPAESGLDEFNELQVIFVRDRERMDKSAKIAIERFILVPR
jgi:hypothetical protein